MSGEASEEEPVYSVFSQVDPAGGPTNWGVQVDQGWRSIVLCVGMYEPYARWLVEQLQGKRITLYLNEPPPVPDLSPTCPCGGNDHVQEQHMYGDPAMPVYRG